MGFETLNSQGVVLERDDIDTDQIIPAAYLSGVDRQGLADGLFFEARKAGGTSFPLNDPSLRDAQILVAGRNFGCGSSREHAVWALIDWGFRAVIAPSFSDIFSANAFKNGLLPVSVPVPFWDTLKAQAVLANGIIVIDLVTQTVTAMDGQTCDFAVDPFARRCLLEGADHLEYLVDQLPSIRHHEDRSPSQ